MSVSPAQNFSKPPPVPAVPTVIFTSGFSAWNASWAAWAKGATVLEPSIAIEPERSAAAAAASAAARVVVVATRSSPEGQHAAGGEREELPHAGLLLGRSIDGADAVRGMGSVCYRAVAAL